MALQSALQCRDILATIFETMSATCEEDVVMDPRERWRPTLASAARVCRAFSDSALAVLWRSLDDVDPIFRVLPSYSCQESGLAYEWLITEEVTPDQWARMQWYATRVRALHGLDAFKSMHSSAWAFIEEVRRNRPLMPNLRCLNAVVSIEDPTGLMRILSPSLREVNVSFAFTRSLPSEQVTAIDASVVGSVIQVVPSKAPHLRKLHVGGPLQNLPSSCLISMRNFQQLRTLDMLYSYIPFNSEALAIVSQMSNLSVLEVEISLQSGLASSGELKFADHFSSLTEIHIRGSLQDLVAFFAATRLNNLRELALTLPSTPSEQAIHDSFARITADISPSLTTVNLYFTCEEISPSTSLSSTRMLEALLRFSQLTLFDMEFDSRQYSPVFTDEDAATFAAAWPELNYFRIWPKNVTRCRPTLDALVHFARHSPLLEDLHLPSLDVSILPPLSSIPALARHNMRRLYVEPLLGWSQTNLLELAAILDRLFPNVQSPRSATVSNFKGRTGMPWERPVPDSGYEPWRLTQILLGAMQLSRTHLASEAGEDEISVSGESLHDEILVGDWED